VPGHSGVATGTGVLLRPGFPTPAARGRTGAVRPRAVRMASRVRSPRRSGGREHPEVAL